MFNSRKRRTLRQLVNRYVRKHGKQSRDQRDQEMNSRSALLSLPRELRDEIIALVIASRRPSLQNAAELEMQSRVPLDISNTWGGSGLYLEEQSAYTPNAGGLLLANKQLRSETQSALERLDLDLAHELDVKLVDERFIAPTWTFIPIPTRHFKHVRAVFQSVGVWQQPPTLSKFKMAYPWAYGCGGPPAYVWQFYSILRHFLTYGVDVPRPTTTPDFISVENLELDFIDPEDTDLLPPEGQTSIWEARCRRSRSRDPQGPELLRPEWLARDLANQMLAMFRMSYHMAEYACMFHGRIGYMVFKVNGTIIEEIDVGQVLADVKFNDSFGNVSREDRVENWTSWKEEAQELRKKRGLKTVEFEDGWQEEARNWAAQHYAKYPSSC